MDHIPRVQVPKGIAYLVNYLSDFVLFVAMGSLLIHESEEVTVGSQFHNKVDVLLVPEVSVHSNDIWVSEARVDIVLSSDVDHVAFTLLELGFEEHLEDKELERLVFSY